MPCVRECLNKSVSLEEVNLLAYMTVNMGDATREQFYTMLKYTEPDTISECINMAALLRTGAYEVYIDVPESHNVGAEYVNKKQPGLPEIIFSNLNFEGIALDLIENGGEAFGDFFITNFNVGLRGYDDTRLYKMLDNERQEYTLQISGQSESSGKEMSDTEREFDDLIAVCENRVRPAPHEYPIYDYPWGIQKVGSVDELIEKFRFGNYSVRTGFVLGDLAFIEQVSGGNEWLALKLDGGVWKSFESISFYHMIKQSGADACGEFIEHLRETPWHDLKYPSESEGPVMIM